MYINKYIYIYHCFASLQVPAGTKSTYMSWQNNTNLGIGASALAKPKSDCPSNSGDISMIILDSSGPRLILPNFCNMPCLGKPPEIWPFFRPPCLPYTNLKGEVRGSVVQTVPGIPCQAIKEVSQSLAFRQPGGMYGTKVAKGQQHLF